MNEMRITVELSLYPLQADFIGPISDFIHELRLEPDIEMVTNQLSTQLRGEFATVMGAVSRCTQAAMNRAHPIVLVAKFVNADLDIASPSSV